MSGYARPLESALHEARLRRNSLAGTLRNALLQLERTPAWRSPDPRAVHERRVLSAALAALLAPAPEAKKHGIEAEINRAVRDLALEDKRQRTCEELLELGR